MRLPISDDPRGDVMKMPAIFRTRYAFVLLCIWAIGSGGQFVIPKTEVSPASLIGGLVGGTLVILLLILGAIMENQARRFVKPPDDVGNGSV